MRSIFSRSLFRPVARQSFSFTPEMGEAVEPQHEEALKMNTSLQEYKQGMKFLHEKKYRLAFEFFKRARNYTNELGYSESWLTIQKKIALTQIQLQRYDDCEKTLETIIEQQLKYQVNEAVLYQSYNNLFLHCLKTNLNKAILLGKALLADQEKEKIPFAYSKQFQFNLGVFTFVEYQTAYLLKNNFTDAKERLRACLDAEPNSLLRGCTLNNLAVASWLHKMPNLREFVSDDDELESQQLDDVYTDEQIDEDFNFVIPLLKRAVKYIETSEGNKDIQKQAYLEQLLDENSIIPKKFVEQSMQGVIHLRHKQSGIPLLNLTEFIFNTAVDKRMEAQFWFKLTMKFFEKNDPSNMDRSLILLAWLCSSSKQYERAEILYRRTLQMLEQTDSYNKVLCLQLLGSMMKRDPKRLSEGEKLISQAYSLAEELPSWSNRLVHVSIPDMEL